MAGQSRWQRYIDAAVDYQRPGGRAGPEREAAAAGAAGPDRQATPAVAAGSARTSSARPAPTQPASARPARSGNGPGELRTWLRDKRTAAAAGRSGPHFVGNTAQRTDFRLVPAAALVWVTAAAGGWLHPDALGVLCAVLAASSGVLLVVVAVRSRGRATGRTADKTADRTGRRAESRSGCRKDQAERRDGRDEDRADGRAASGQGGAPRSRLATAAVALLLAAVAGSSSAVASVQRHDAELAGAVQAQAPVVAELVVAGAPRRLTSPGRSGLADRWAVSATLTAVGWNSRRIRAAAGVLVIGGPDWARSMPGQRIRTTGKLRQAEPGEVEAAILSVSSAPQTLAAAGALQRGAAALREGLSGAAGRFGGDAGGLLPGMVTGDTSNLDPALETAMKTAGMSHLTAVSGANCSLILGAFLLAARSFRLSRVAAVVVCLAGLAMFVLVVGPDASVLRAALMGAIGLVSLAGGRTGGSLSYLCLAIIGLLLADPALSTGFGFLLSVLATLGIVVAGRPIMSWLPPAVPRWAAAGLAVPFAAQVFCGPAVVLLQPQFATYALVANLAASALVPPVTLLGTIAVPLLPLSPGLAAAPLAAAAVFATGVAGIARFFAGLPGAVLPWPEGPYGMATMALFSVIALTTLRLVLRPAGIVELALAAHAFTVAILDNRPGRERPGTAGRQAAPAGNDRPGATSRREPPEGPAPGLQPPDGQPASARRPGRERPAAGTHRGLVDRPDRGTLRVCKRTSRRNHQWLLPRPNAPGPARRTRPPGAT